MNNKSERKTMSGRFDAPGGIPGSVSVAALMLAAFVLAVTLRTALADQATGEIKSTLSQVWMFSEIATRHADAEQDAAWGAFGNGFEAARAIDNPWGRAWAFGKLASTLIELVNTGKGTLTKPW